MNPQIIAIEMDDNCKLCSEDVVCIVVDVQCHLCGVFHFSTCTLHVNQAHYWQWSANIKGSIQCLLPQESVRDISGWHQEGHQAVQKFRTAHPDQRAFGKPKFMRKKAVDPV